MKVIQRSNSVVITSLSFPENKSFPDDFNAINTDAHAYFEIREGKYGPRYNDRQVELLLVFREPKEDGSFGKVLSEAGLALFSKQFADKKLITNIEFSCATGTLKIDNSEECTIRFKQPGEGGGARPSRVFNRYLMQMTALLKVLKEDANSDFLGVLWETNQLFILVNKDDKLRIVRANQDGKELHFSRLQLTDELVPISNNWKNWQRRTHYWSWEKHAEIRKHIKGDELLLASFLPGRRSKFEAFMKKKTKKWKMFDSGDSGELLDSSSVESSDTYNRAIMRRLKALGLKDTPIARLLLEIQDLQ